MKQKLLVPFPLCGRCSIRDLLASNEPGASTKSVKLAQIKRTLHRQKIDS